jgi:hypothetical protein
MVIAVGGNNGEPDRKDSAIFFNTAFRLLGYGSWTGNPSDPTPPKFPLFPVLIR